MSSDPTVVAAAAALRARLPALDYRVGLVLGSGLGPVAECLGSSAVVPRGEVPHFPEVGVEGHRGVIQGGLLGETPAVALSGRAHLYEGYSALEVVFPLRVLHALGVRTVVLTSASGGMKPEMRPGDLLVVSDHINLTGTTPISGEFWTEGPDFLDLTDCYDYELRRRTVEVARSRGLAAWEEVLAVVRGPQYETPAEIRMLRGLGASAVCMSLAPEAIAARHLGMRVLGVTIIANPAAGLSPDPIRHADVVARVSARAGDLGAVLAEVLQEV